MPQWLHIPGGAYRCRDAHTTTGKLGPRAPGSKEKCVSNMRKKTDISIPTANVKDYSVFPYCFQFCEGLAEVLGDNKGPLEQASFQHGAATNGGSRSFSNRGQGWRRQAREVIRKG